MKSSARKPSPRVRSPKIATRGSKRKRSAPSYEKTDPLESAKAAHLRYVNDAEPGFRRLRRGAGFRYLDQHGAPVRDAAHLERIRHIVIPPAWTDVWICPTANGHIQATGRDARGRKQYRYHPRFREVRDETKYERMIAFGEALPSIRRAVADRLASPQLTRERVLATVVRLLELTFIRVGNEEYTRTNGSYGLTTLRTRHVEVEGSTIHFHFRGKSRVEHTIDLDDRRLAKILRRCQELPGEVLFQYVDAEGKPRAVEANDVNETIRELSGQDFSAKDFRTWAGTMLAASHLSKLEPVESVTATKKNLQAVIRRVSTRLGNTPAVCRKCYVHPVILDAYTRGALTNALPELIADVPKASPASGAASESQHDLTPHERAVLAFIRSQHTENRSHAA